VICNFEKVGVTSIESPQQIVSPYPKIFANESTVESTTLATSWQSSRSIGCLIDKTTCRLERTNLSKLHRFNEAGLEQDDLAEVIEDLKTLGNCYTPEKWQDF